MVGADLPSVSIERVLVVGNGKHKVTLCVKVCIQERTTIAAALMLIVYTASSSVSIPEGDLQDHHLIPRTPRSRVTERVLL